MEERAGSKHTYIITKECDEHHAHGLLNQGLSERCPSKAAQGQMLNQ